MKFDIEKSMAKFLLKIDKRSVRDFIKRGRITKKCLKNLDFPKLNRVQLKVIEDMLNAIDRSFDAILKPEFRYKIDSKIRFKYEKGDLIFHKSRKLIDLLIDNERLNL